MSGSEEPEGFGDGRKSLALYRVWIVLPSKKSRGCSIGRHYDVTAESRRTDLHGRKAKSKNERGYNNISRGVW